MTGTFDTGTMLIIFAIGLVVGFLLTKYTSGSVRDTQALKQKLDELKTEHRDYQENVNTHFIKTTDLIQKMNQNYKEIQAHVMQGAELLVSPDFQLEVDDSIQALESQDNGDAFSPPKDWAPKSPDEGGTLSESFGFQKKPAKKEAEYADNAEEDFK